MQTKIKLGKSNLMVPAVAIGCMRMFDLDEKKADVVFKNDIDNDVLKKAVEEVGFEVVNVQ